MSAELTFATALPQLELVARDWDRLASGAPRFYPSFADTHRQIERENPSFLTVTAQEGSAATGLACFFNHRTQLGFTVGERRLFSLPVRETTLHGAWVLGDLDESTLRKVLLQALRQWPCDLFTLGEVEIGSPLHIAATSLGPGLVTTRQARKDAVRWFIDLPDSFEAYLNGLRSSTRQSVRSKMRRFEREMRSRTEIIERPDQVARFLSDGEQISRRTYQWQVGQQLRNDQPTQERYHRLAAQGRLRCYMTYVDDEPCAFLRGEISGNVFHYETPGFDPRFEKASPGIVQLFWTIRDLIENTDCRVFDFGPGGDLQGYKARFGNRAIPSRLIQLANVRQPYSLALFSLQTLLSTAKDLASAALGDGRLRQRVKKALRSSGAG